MLTSKLVQPTNLCKWLLWVIGFNMHRRNCKAETDGQENNCYELCCAQ